VDDGVFACDEVDPGVALVRVGGQRKFGVESNDRHLETFGGVHDLTLFAL